MIGPEIQAGRAQIPPGKFIVGATATSKATVRQEVAEKMLDRPL